jgi:hypothetical protein
VDPRHQRKRLERDLLRPRARTRACGDPFEHRGGFAVSVLPEQASRQRPGCVCPESTIRDQLRRGAHRSQRGFRFDEPRIVGPQDPDRDDRLETDERVGGEKSGALALPQSVVGAAAVAQDPSQGQRALAGLEAVASRFEHPRGALEQPHGRRMSSRCREPRGARAGAVERASNSATGRLAGHRAFVFHGVRGAGLVHDGRPAVMAVDAKRTQVLNHGARAALCLSHSGGELGLRRAVVVIQIHHRLQGRTLHRVDREPARERARIAREPQQNVPARAGHAERGQHAGQRLHRVDVLESEERNVSIANAVGEPSLPGQNSCAQRHIPVDPRDAGGKRHHRSDARPSRAGNRDVHHSTGRRIGQDVGQVIENSAALQHDADRTTARRRPRFERTQHRRRQARRERDIARCQEPGDVTQEQRRGLARRPHRGGHLVRFEAAAVANQAVVDQRLDEGMAQAAHRVAAIRPRTLIGDGAGRRDAKLHTRAACEIEPARARRDEAIGDELRHDRVLVVQEHRRLETREFCAVFEWSRTGTPQKLRIQLPFEWCDF